MDPGSPRRRITIVAADRELQFAPRDARRSYMIPLQLIGIKTSLNASTYLCTSG